MLLSFLTDILHSSSTPIFTGDGEGGSGFTAAAAAAAGGMSGFDFGVDPNLDPELALALRISMEEERARQEAAAKKATEDTSKEENDGKQASSSRDVGMAEAVSSSHNNPDKKDDQMVSLSLCEYFILDFSLLIIHIRLRRMLPMGSVFGYLYSLLIST